jgi:hypothetical protein
MIIFVHMLIDLSVDVSGGIDDRHTGIHDGNMTGPAVC